MQGSRDRRVQQAREQPRSAFCPAPAAPRHPESEIVGHACHAPRRGGPVRTSAGHAPTDGRNVRFSVSMISRWRRRLAGLVIARSPRKLPASGPGALILPRQCGPSRQPPGAIYGARHLRHPGQSPGVGRRLLLGVRLRWRPPNGRAAPTAGGDDLSRPAHGRADLATEYRCPPARSNPVSRRASSGGHHDRMIGDPRKPPSRAFGAMK